MTAHDYAPAPPDAPPMNGPDEYEMAERDAEYEAAMAVIHHNEKVADRVAFLRIDRDARARLAIELHGEVDFTDQYLTRAQLDSLPTPEPLISNVIPRHSYGVLRGRDQSLKSFNILCL